MLLRADFVRDMSGVLDAGSSNLVIFDAVLS